MAEYSFLHRTFQDEFKRIIDDAAHNVKKQFTGFIGFEIDKFLKSIDKRNFGRYNSFQQSMLIG